MSVEWSPDSRWKEFRLFLSISFAFLSLSCHSAYTRKQGTAHAVLLPYVQLPHTTPVGKGCEKIIAEPWALSPSEPTAFVHSIAGVC